MNDADTSAAGIRQDSKLEVDDPEHCKQCGGGLPTKHAVEDDDGRPMIWQYDEGEWLSIELCPSCWSEQKLAELRRECMERYNGRYPEVLARD